MRTKRNIEAVVSAMGALLTVVVNLVKHIQEFKGNVGRSIYLLAQPEGDITLKAIAKLIAELALAEVQAAKTEAKEIVTPYLESVHDAVVDFGQNLGQMVTQGNFDGVNSDITAVNFSIAKGQGKKAVKIELLHFNQYFSNGDLVIAKLKEVNDWLASQGANYHYRFDRIEELLALAVVQPDFQRRFPIGALNSDSIWHHAGGRDFAYLSRYGSARSLGLGRLGRGFDGVWRFAVVREQS